MVQKTCPALASMAIDSLIHEFPKASLRSLVQHASPCTHHLVDYTITGKKRFAQAEHNAVPRQLYTCWTVDALYYAYMKNWYCKSKRLSLKKN